jgi:hypothetical protein
MPSPSVSARGTKLVLYAAFDERIGKLQADRAATNAWASRPGLRPCGIPAGYVGKARMPYLSRAHKIIERTHDLLRRGHAIPGVQEIEIDVIRLQAFQRGIDRAHDILASIAAGIRIARRDIVRELRGNDQMVAKPGVGDEAADEALAHTPGIGIRRVDEIAAGLDITMEDRAGGRFITAPRATDTTDTRISECHRAERKAGYSQTGAA